MRHFLSILICLLALLDASAQTPSVKSVETLNVEVSGLRSEKGHLALQLFKDGELVGEEMTAISGAAVHLSFSGLSRGTYQIKYFHDENDNVELDTNFIGIPTEGYGFSNNAKGFMGPPDDEETFFQLEEGGKTVRLEINYLLGS
jgi:uncharacterized protein (DUF2141 family)